MIQISEVLPNPIGKDSEGEWIELWNNGPALSVSGWRLNTSGKGKYVLSGNFKEGERRVFYRPQTKLSLKNEGETISLYDSKDNLIDEARYSFVATEGKSLVRDGKHLVLGEPTPGEENKNLFSAELIKSEIPQRMLANNEANFGLNGLGLALFLSLGILFLLKSNEDLSHLFFGGDKRPRKETSSPNF